MGPRTLVIWGAAALVSTVAAVVVTLDARRDVTEAARLDEPVFEALRQSPETAAAVTIVHGGDELRVARAEARWVVPAAHGYAADASALRDLLTALADLRWAAPRTALAERYARLEVDDPGPESAATRVTVTADGGAILADAIIGKRSRAISGDERGTYLRLPEAERAWLAKGTVEVATAALDWLDTELPSLARDELKVVVVEPAAGAGFTAGRTTPEEDMTLVDQLPLDRTADAAEIRRLASAFASLRFEEVRPAGEVDWPEVTTTITGTGFGGETVALQLATLAEGERWVRFADVADWVYKLPTFQIDRLDKRIGDLVSRPEPS